MLFPIVARRMKNDTLIVTGILERNYDLEYWTVWPTTPNQIKSYGSYDLKYELVDTGRARDGETGLPKIRFFDNICGSYTEWMDFTSFVKGYPYLVKELEREVTAAREQQKKLHERKRRKEREMQLKQDAERLGISVQTLKERRKKERQKQRKDKKKQKSVDRTNRLMQVGPTIKELQEELDKLQNKIANNEPVNIKHPDRYKKKLQVAINVIREWQELQK